MYCVEIYANTGVTIQSRLAKTFDRLLKVMFELKDSEGLMEFRKTNGLLNFGGSY